MKRKLALLTSPRGKMSLLALLVVLIVSASGAIRRGPDRRLIPSIEYYKVPRSVGATSVVPDMSMGPIPWWNLTTGRPFWQTVETMRDHGLTAIGVLQRAHPTINYWENIRRGFRTPGIDIIVIEPLHWASTERGCVGGKNIRWQNIPPSIFEDLYGTYGGQNKIVIVQLTETDWTVNGVGCRERDQCVTAGGYFSGYFEACKQGTLVPYYEYDGGTDCAVIACDMVKLDRAEYLLNQMNDLQAAAMAARAAHPNAKLRVFFSVEVNFFTDQFYIVARDLISQMPVPPDFIGLSLYRDADDVVTAFNNVIDWTGLPPWRIFVSEVGAREGTQSDGSYIDGTPQYDRIVPVVSALFDRGAAFALVWSFEEVAYTGGHTGRAVIDSVTGEHLSGYDAIIELNEEYRHD